LFVELVWVVKFAGLGWVFKLRWEAWDKILSLIAAWVRMDIESVVIESLLFQFITDGGWRGETILGDVVVTFGGGWRKVKSSIGVRPS
jgi:hypothetical protein